MSGRNGICSVRGDDFPNAPPPPICPYELSTTWTCRIIFRQGPADSQVRTFANFWETRRIVGYELDNWPIDQCSLYDLIIGGGGVGTVQAKHVFEI